MRKLIIVLTLVFASYGLFSVGYVIGEVAVGSSNIAPLTGSMVPPNQDPTLLSYALELGIDVSNVNLVYQEVQATNLDGAVGGFMEPNTIQIKPGLDEELTKIVLAHEYMHYAYSSVSSDVRQSVIDVYNLEMSKDAWIKDRLKDYHDCDNSCLAGEAIAYSCSELPPHRLSEEFNTWCEQFIKNRKILF